jgi:putative ABC transport system permease protein
VLRGRGIAPRDVAGQPLVAVVDQAFAHHFFSEDNAIGHRIAIDVNDHPRWLTIVGVVGNIVQDAVAASGSIATNAQTSRPQWSIWLPQAQSPGNFMSGVLRVKGNPTGYVRAVQDAVLAVRADIPIYYPETLASIVRKALWKQRMFGELFAGFAGLALFLAAIGIYGVMSYAVAQRTQEIGIRMALGAQRREVIAMVLRQGVRLVGAGLACGITGAWFAATALTAMLHGISPHDPPTFVFVPLLLGLVALLACYVPSRRATLVDPLLALRAE